MNKIIIMGVTFFAGLVWATQIPFRDLADLVSDSDYIFIGTVEKVDMVDAEGNQVKNDNARTGPGIDNQLRLHIKIAANEIILSTADNLPETVIIPLWQRWHDTLGNQKRESEGKTYIFLLKGDEFIPVYHSGFMLNVSEKAEIEVLVREKTTQEKAVGNEKK